MTHMSSYRHLGNKRMFAPVFKAEDKQQHQQQKQHRDQQREQPRKPESNEWPPPKSRHSQPEPLAINGLPQPHKRFRPGTIEN